MYVASSYRPAVKRHYSVKIPEMENPLIVVQYPHEFVESPNKKFVRVLAVNVTCIATEDAFGNEFANGQYLKPSHIAFHATFNQEYDNSNHFICMSNEQLVKAKEYEQYTTQMSFKLWFKDELSGDLLTPDDQVSIIIQLELEF